MSDSLLNAADLYAKGLQRVESRRQQWIDKHTELRDHLAKVAEFLNEHSKYKQGFFVDTLLAFNEDMNGTSTKMPSVSFRSGPMPMLVTFRNTMGEKKTLMEEGFHISFNPTITGQIVVLLLPHQSELNKEPLPYSTLAVINEPEKLSMDYADELIEEGIEAAFYTSFTGMGEQQEDNRQPVYERHPIGFRIHETTEKVK
jgi:hypothetical protein